MNFKKDRVDMCKTCTCGDRLKAERVLFWLLELCTQLLSNSLIHKSFLLFQHNNTKESCDTSRIM